MENVIRDAENRDTHDVICSYTMSSPSARQPILMLGFVSMELVKYGKKFGRVICVAIYSYSIADCSQSDFILTRQTLLGKEDAEILFFPIKLMQKNLTRLALFLAKS